MSASEFVPTREQVATVFEYAELPMEDARLDEKLELYSSTLSLIRQASVAGLGETAPAAAFKASWT